MSEADITSAQRRESLLTDLMQRGSLPEVLQVIAAVSEDARSAVDWLLAGVAHHRLGQLSEAVACYQRAVALDPGLASAWRNMAAICYESDHYQWAVECLERYQELVPYDRQGFSWHLYSLCKLGRLADAENLVEDFVSVYRYDPVVWQGQAYLYEQQQRYLAALTVSFKASEADLSHTALGHIALACLQNLDRLEVVDAWIDRIFPPSGGERDAAYWQVRGDCASLRGDRALAESCYRRWLAQESLDPEAVVNLSLTLLGQGKFEEGWALFRRRGGGAKMRKLEAIPEWAGEPLVGKIILVHSEQGLGDVIQFVRYLPYLRATGATVVFNTYPDILRLVEHDPRAQRPDEAQLAAVDHVDYQTYLMDFPALLRPGGIADFPDDVPYLFSEPAKTVSWRERLQQYRGLRVGLVWAGSPTHGNDHRRSAALADFAPLAWLPGVTFFSLQKGHTEPEAEAPPAGMRFVNLSPEISDFSDTAAIVANLDLLLCVDTSVAHLAGAMGRQCWTLVPKTVRDWRWGMDDGASPWYPTLKIFSQRTDRDWRGLVREGVLPELAQLILAAGGGSESLECEPLKWLLTRLVDGDEVDAWIDSALQSGRIEEAITAARGLLHEAGLETPAERLWARLDASGHPGALVLRVDALLRKGEVDAAVDLLTCHAGAMPLPVDHCLAWGRSLTNQKLLQRAGEVLQSALLHHPKHADLLAALGHVKLRMGDRDAAREAFELAVNYAPRHVTSLCGLAETQEKSAWIKSSELLQRAVMVGGPQAHSAWRGLAGFVLTHRVPSLAAVLYQWLYDCTREQSDRLMMLLALGMSGQQDRVRMLLNQQPLGDLVSPDDRSRYASLLRGVGRDDDAIAELWSLLKVFPERTSDHFYLGVTLLKNGCFTDGWREYALGLQRRELPVPEWTGESLEGRRLFVFQDQGYGDLIQFMVLLRKLRELRPRHIALGAAPDILKLLEPLGLADEVLSSVDFIPQPADYDYYVAIMKLPHLLGADLDHPPFPTPYLHVSGGFLPQWERACAEDSALKIGIVWAGNPHYANDHHRSTRLDDWSVLADVEGVSLYSLQKDAASSQAFGCPQLHLRNIAANCDSMLATAEAITMLDLVISVDSGLAHLAAALDKPTWILLPDVGLDFRWREQREDCPWYPSVRLQRKRPGEGWADVLRRVAEELVRVYPEVRWRE